MRRETRFTSFLALNLLNIVNRWNLATPFTRLSKEAAMPRHWMIKLIWVLAGPRIKKMYKPRKYLIIFLFKSYYLEQVGSLTPLKSH